MTVTSTVPAEPAGAVAVIEVSLLTVKLIAAGGAELDCRRVGEVRAGDRDRRPAAVGPALGLTLVTVGTAA